MKNVVLTETALNDKHYSKRVSQHIKRDVKQRIVEIVVEQKKYLVKGFSAVQLAEETGVDVRYISATIHSEFKMNYATFVNKYRVKEAARILRRINSKSLTTEEVGDMVGFSNRQSFYSAFISVWSMTPFEYRREMEAQRQLRKSYKMNAKIQK